MKSATTPLAEVRINTYEGPLLQHECVCLVQHTHISKYVPTRACTPRWD